MSGTGGGGPTEGGAAVPVGESSSLTGIESRDVSVCIAVVRPPLRDETERIKSSTDMAEFNASCKSKSSGDWSATSHFSERLVGGSTTRTPAHAVHGNAAAEAWTPAQAE